MFVSSDNITNNVVEVDIKYKFKGEVFKIGDVVKIVTQEENVRDEYVGEIKTPTNPDIFLELNMERIIPLEFIIEMKHI